MDSVNQKKTTPRIPRTVWMLGLVSLLMDTSSELIHSLLPVFLVTTLGASASVLGVLEGVSEAMAYGIKLFSGALSDWLGKRKPLLLLGYGLAAFSKPLFPLAGSIAWVAVARVTDRIGKGLRGAPRDALIADVAPPAVRGASYGLRQTLDTTGAVLGPLAAMGLLLLYAGDIRSVLWWAVIPGVAAVVLLAKGVQEAPHAQRPARVRKPWQALPAVGRQLWPIFSLAALLAAARGSEAFLVLRSRDLGLPMAGAPLILLTISVLYALSTYAAGKLADGGRARSTLALSAAVLVAAHATAATVTSGSGVIIAAALWGLHMGLSQSPLSALLSHAAPAHLRGNAFGLFNLSLGVGVLLGSTLMGVLWDVFSPDTAFLLAATLAVLGIPAALFLPRLTDSA